MKPNLIIAISLFLGVSIASGVSADTSQYGQYGAGTPSYSIAIDKMVMTKNQTKGGQEIYVDNLTPSDPRYSPDERIYFLIKVKNTSNITLQNVEVEDRMPEWLAAIEGPGEYIANERVVKWKYNELAAGEEKTEKIIAQVLPQAQLPADKGLFCLNNKAWSRSGTAYDEDTAQFCIEKQVITNGGQPVTTTPQAGAPLLAFGALNLLGLGVGVWMRGKS
ncbi:hypothetical protein COY14_02125 [Candidatus Roizmanbacteria bacterium CG_4_10_14_0_2_um_filter_36_9]|uniref:DUF11 domain-containing protein n=1 Tax=Candidatus Roizmanbacteria bacterium CG_4_10_14_0_2_um_filter_36_9 TaxID=1974823 RepID=A0A2M7U4E3_9BACT|nr:MAG: hypothetical protein COY14_02125 [Candidatus Roizmanbacteria bacterium CG_4_10_14_0_2_um_filter_36_9]